MNIEKAVKEVQGRIELVGERSQDVAKVSIKTLKAANEIVVEGVQGVVAVQTAAAKDLYTAGKQSFEKAVSAGLVAVAKSPVEFLPEGRETIVGAFNETVDTVTKTGEKLAKVAKSGYQGIAASIQGKPIRKPAAKKARKAVATAVAA
jgi:Phasin protein